MEKDFKNVEIWVQAFLNNPDRQKIIDSPQTPVAGQPLYMPKHTLHNKAGDIIGYWDGDIHHYKDNKLKGYKVPVFLPILPPFGEEWNYDTVSGKFFKR